MGTKGRERRSVILIVRLVQKLGTKKETLGLLNWHWMGKSSVLKAAHRETYIFVPFTFAQ